MDFYHVAVIGGGASGSACAARLSHDKNIKIALIEAADRLGKKLAQTGNGQGNISNTEMTAGHYHGGGAYLAGRIACGDPYAGAKLFNLVCTADDRGRIYPAGRQASALVDSLKFTLHNNGVSVILSTTVTAINGDDNGGFVITLSDGRKIGAKYAVVCTGGMAQPVCKTFSPYALAKAAGHGVTEVYPSLVQLKTDTAHVKSLKGIRADCFVSAVNTDGAVAKARGDVIFTDYGVSGNSIFSVSPVFADAAGEITIEFLPEISETDIKNDIITKQKLGYPESELLSGTLHNQIGRAIIRRVGSGNAEKIARAVKNFTLTVNGTLGFAYAQVTRGGVKADEITDELESKLVKNLFFAGEVLDVDGDCGGYNLQWAFTSAQKVAETILKRL